MSSVLVGGALMAAIWFTVRVIAASTTINRLIDEDDWDAEREAR